MDTYSKIEGKLSLVLQLHLHFELLQMQAVYLAALIRQGTIHICRTGYRFGCLQQQFDDLLW